MKQLIRPLAVLVAFAVLALPCVAAAQTATAIPPAISTPDKVETRIGTLDFKDGMPSKETIAKVYDNLDFTHAFEAFVNTFQGVSIAALHKGFQSIGVKDNEVLIFSELMDAKSLFLTANADTIYYHGHARPHQGSHGARGAAQDAGRHRRLVVPLGHRFGPPGPDRGEGRKVPHPAARLRWSTCPRVASLSPAPGPTSSSGSLARSWRTTTRSRSSNRSRSSLKIYPYEAGGYGTPIAEFLAGKAKLGPSPRRRRPCSTKAPAR